MALEAQSRLRGLQQSFLGRNVIRRRVHAVTANAADIGLGMWRAFEVGVRSRVAGLAHGVDFLDRVLGRIENLGHVAAAGHVFAARAVAVLAGHTGVVSGHVDHLLVGVRSKFL